MNREAFEAWVVNFRSNVILRRFENGEYVSAVTENYFSVWNAALALQAKRIEEHIELIEATAEFSKSFWEKADKHRDTRVMVSTFQQLERKLRTYLPASKNGE